MLSYQYIFTAWALLFATVYLALFVIKQTTNVRIRRFGYLSLRHIDLPTPEGIAVHIGFLGFRLRRPTITKPTWISFIIQNVDISIDLGVVHARQLTHAQSTKQTMGKKPKSSVMKSFAKLAARIQQISSYRIIRWIDFLLVDTTLNVKDCGCIQLGMLHLRLVQKERKGERRLHVPMSIESNISTLLTTDDNQPHGRGIELFGQLSNLRFKLQEEAPFEVMDSLLVNVWSEFGTKVPLQNTGISLKFGKVQLVIDDFLKFLHRTRPTPSEREAKENIEPTVPEVTEDKSLSDDSEDLRPLFDVLTEVQVHVGFLKASYQAHDVTPAGKPVILTASAKDAVLDVNKLNETSPDFRMLFESGTIAHQALFSLISLSIQINANDCEETALSIPMLTLASKTSSLAHFILEHDNSLEAVRKLNITTLNTVITSPASNINAMQIPVLMALVRPRVKGHAGSRDSPSSQPINKANLPRFDFSLGVHDPSIRVVLESTSSDDLPPMIIGRLSSFYMEAHGSHSGNEYLLKTLMRTNASRLYYHSPNNTESDVLNNTQASLGLSAALLPMSNARIDGMLDGFHAELSRSEIIECFARITASLQSPDVLPAKLPAQIHHKEKTHPLSKVPTWIEGVKLQARNFSLLISGRDIEVAPDSRGINAVFDDLLFDYGKNTTSVQHDNNENEMTDDFYRGHVSNLLKQNGTPSSKFHLYRKGLATIHALRIFTVDSDSVLDKKHALLSLPLAEVAISQSTDNVDDLLHIGFRIEDIVLGFSLFKVYAILQTLRVLRTSFMHSNQAGTTTSVAASQRPNGVNAVPSKGKLQITIEGKVNLLRIKTRLPLDECQMLDLDHIRITKGLVGDAQVRMRYARFYIDSPCYPGRWDRIVSIRDIQISRETHTEKAAEGVKTVRSLAIRTDALRIRVPHQFIFYKMLESIINSVKTSTQIIHRFVTQTNDYVIAQHPKQAKALPRVRVKSRILAIEVEDDPFESRLGMIFRVGLSEQRMREAREVAFDRKVMKLREMATAPGSNKAAPSLIRTKSLHSAPSVRSGHTSARSFTDSIDTSDDLESTSYSSADMDMEYPAEREKLLYHNSRAWISRIQYALSFRHKKMHDIRQQKWGKDEISHAGGHTETIMEISNRPPLLSILFSGVDLTLDKPSFPLDHLPEYMHRVGRGMPLDMRYSLLIPVNLRWKMDEARVNVRDYPLPLLHVPPLHTSQRTSASSWDFSTDLVIAEEFPDYEAIRHIEVNVVPANTGRKGSPAFNVEVQRTASSVKTYAEMSIDLNSSLPTRVHWGTSMQPGVGDAMRILDTLSKPQTDPSPKLGFWDKIGLVMHTSIKLNWKHDGDMHITLKGSRDPYVVMGSGAGLTKVFRGNVRWHIGVCPDPRRLMEVMCDEYMLAISDFSRRNTSAGAPRTKADFAGTSSKNTLHHHHLSRKELNFQKILMKLTGDVRWTAGLAFERHCEEGDCDKCNGAKECRIWDFKPHWLVKLRIPEFSILPGGKARDAFKGYRSNYIHGQISVTSRKRADAGESYNTMHLTPKFFAHFYDWIHSFSGNLSLPIRSGPLFPSAEGPKQKLGQHLMTLKYNLQLEPLYLTHMYKSANTQDPTKIDMTGVKARIDSFTLDLHQRREERVVTNKMLETQRTSSHMAIYRGQVDLRVTDLRALTAIFEVDHSKDAQQNQFKKDPLNPEDDPRGEHAARLGQFDVAKEDIEWIDMDDFTELDTLLPEKSPICKIIPLAYAPRFVYDRDTTHLEGKQSENALNNVVVPGQRFGFEKTHLCSMVKDNGAHANEDLGEAQQELWANRREFLKQELERNEQHLKAISSSLSQTPDSNSLNEEVGYLHGAKSATNSIQQRVLQDHHLVLKEKMNFVDNLKSNVRRLYANEINAVKSLDPDLEQQHVNDEDGIDYMRRVKAEVRSFNNRFIVHDIQMKWNNTLRNVLIRYIQQVNQRRGFSYYMSQKAVRFLSDLVEEQLRNKQKAETNSVNGDANEDGAMKTEICDEVEQLIKKLLDDREENFIVPDETSQKANITNHNQPPTGKDEENTNDLHEDYEAVNNYILRLVAPQIQLQSEKNQDAVIILAAQSMQMKILAIKDKTIAGDDVSALVQRKFSVQMTSAQFFYAHKNGFNGAVANLLTQNNYGAKTNTYWPPWVPIESVYDFETNPRAFQRIVDRTSALCTYTKNNQLRIKKNDHIQTGNQLSSNRNEADDRTDSITVNFPKFNLAADSEQYYAMFTIAMDLLIYSEPLQKERNEQIEKILLAADFSDLSGAPEMVSSLQKRIRQMNDFKAQFRLHAQASDPQSKSDELRVAKELEQCEDELFFLMKSVATAQQKHEDRDSEVIPAMRWQLKAEEILWHLMEGKKAFIDFGMSKASFKRTDNSDSSNFNTLEVEMMQGINLSPDPVFAQLFAPYFGSDRTVVDARRSKMVRIYWYMLEAIGGIAVCDHFEVNLFPLRMQMEHDVGKKLFAYVFPDKQKKNAKADSDTDSEDEDDANNSSSDDVDDAASTISTSRKSTTHKHSKLSLSRLRHSASLSRLTHRDSNNHASDLSSIYSHESDSRDSSRRLSRTDSLSSLQRLTTSGTTSKALVTNGKKKPVDASSDDLTAMMNRASKNMSLVYVKVPSVVLALSYKGAKAKNFVDVTDFVFKMPTIEYRNKTWSYLDLAEHLKREVIKAVLAHTGSLLRDKMTHYRKSKQRQPILSKQLTSYRNFMPAEASERKYLEEYERDPADHVSEHDVRAEHALQNRTSTAETTSLALDGDHHSHGLFNNAIGRHIQHLSHIARHKDGLAEDSAESTMKKTRMLLGKFIDKAK